jgi:hypothetical protein
MYPTATTTPGPINLLYTLSFERNEENMSGIEKDIAEKQNPD